MLFFWILSISDKKIILSNSAIVLLRISFCVIESIIDNKFVLHRSPAILTFSKDSSFFWLFFLIFILSLSLLRKVFAKYLSVDFWSLQYFLKRLFFNSFLLSLKCFIIKSLLDLYLLKFSSIIFFAISSGIFSPLPILFSKELIILSNTSNFIKSPWKCKKTWSGYFAS